MHKFIFNAPFNSLSFGNVSFNILRECYKRDLEVVIFPISDNVDFSAYHVDADFARWIDSSIKGRYLNIKRELPTLKLWHISGSEQKLSDRQILLTFHELNRPTNEELNLLKLQSDVIWSNFYSKQIFGLSGLKDEKQHVVPLGFDEDFKRLTKTYFGKDDVVHFTLSGKWEKRKRTREVLRSWIKKYGNNPKYLLSCLISNPFLKSEHMNALIAETLQPFGGKLPFNVNFLNRLKTNAEMNDFYNSSDIDLSGLSGAEAWNFGAFNTCALGKQVIVLDAHGHKTWADKDNAILVEADGMETAADGIFFQEGGPFNQGSIYTFSEDEVISAMELAESRVEKGEMNEAGIKLQETFTYQKTLDGILSVIN